MNLNTTIGLLIVFVALFGFAYSLWQVFKHGSSNNQPIAENSAKSPYKTKRMRENNGNTIGAEPHGLKMLKEGKRRRFTGEILPYLKWPRDTAKEREAIREEQAKLRAYIVGDTRFEAWN